MKFFYKLILNKYKNNGDETTIKAIEFLIKLINSPKYYKANKSMINQLVSYFIDHRKFTEVQLNYLEKAERYKLFRAIPLEKADRAKLFREIPCPKK